MCPGPGAGGAIIRCDPQREKTLPLNQLVQIFSEVCAALDYAHQKKIVHRDLKPSNIIICIEEDANLTAGIFVEMGHRCAACGYLSGAAECFDIARKIFHKNGNELEAGTAEERYQATLERQKNQSPE